MTTQSSIAEKWAMEVHSELKTEELIRLFQRAIDEAVETADLEWMRIAQRRADKLAALDEAHAWQPIATAPKGIDIMGYESGCDDLDFYFCRLGCDSYGTECWIDINDHMTVNPTHWQPLPEPPKEATCDGGWIVYCDVECEHPCKGTKEAASGDSLTTQEYDDCGNPTGGKLITYKEAASDG